MTKAMVCELCFRQTHTGFPDKTKYFNCVYTLIRNLGILNTCIKIHLHMIEIIFQIFWPI